MKKPSKMVNKELPLSQLTDKEFELLLFQCFRRNGSIYLDFDVCYLVAGTGDQGRDIILLQNEKTVGVIQCKKYDSSITKPQAVKEIIKFVLHAIQQPNLYDFNNLTYYFAVSKGFNTAAATLLEHFSIQIEAETKLKEWIIEVQSEFKRIGENNSSDFNCILEVLKSIHVRKLLPHDIGGMIDDQIIKIFFNVDKVIDIKSFRDLKSPPHMSLQEFMKQYRESQKNNFSRINFFGLSLSTKPREVSFEKLFVEPTLHRHKQKQGYSKHFYPDTNHVKNSNKMSLTLSTGAGKSLIAKEFSNKVFQDLLSKQTSSLSTSLQSAREFIDMTGLLFNSFLQMSPKSNQDKLQVNVILNSPNNIIILGKPGAGKSSLVKHLMIHILTKQFNIIPIRVELHKYNHRKKQDSIGFIDYIFNHLQTEHQMHKLMKEDIINFLSINKVIIFFDGMDEVLDVHERISVRNDIENIAGQYKNLKCIVTSRYESYNEVHFNGQQFEIFEVNDFDDEQVTEFVNKWYGIEESNSDIRQREVESCLKELHHIEDELKRNPLLLTLIVILYRNELELPTSKLDVYESCTLTLVDTRDNREKKLMFELPISNKIATFSSLAYWQFEKLLSQEHTILTYTAVHKHVRNYLINKGEYEYEHEADKVAQSFLEFANIRSIYVENNFTHKTFLEYFTAYYLYSTLFSKGKVDELHQFISTNFTSSSWYVVIELLICKIDKAQGDFSVIDEIVERQLNINEEQTLLFFLAILKHLQNISPRMINRLFERSIKTIIQNEKSEKSGVIRSLNSHLIDLMQSERFAIKLSEKLDEYENKISLRKENNIYNIYVIENNLVTTSRYTQMLRDYDYFSNIRNSTPYLFTLITVPLINEANMYVIFLKEYIELFNDKALITTHHTKYGNNIFFGANSFHWIASYLFSKDYYRFVETVKLLMDNGMNRRRIIEGINQDTGSIKMTNDELVTILEFESHGARKEIILAALKKYYDRSSGNKSNGPFYKNLNKRNRRFPIPK